VSERIHESPVVSAMASGLNNDVFGKAQMISQGKQLLFAGIAGRVLSLWRVGKNIRGSKHMAMRIDRTRRQFELWF
jgi:hypothetical protein